MSEAGHKTALGLALAAFERDGGDGPEQLDLFGAPAPSPIEVQPVVEGERQALRGRPPGSRNKRTDELARHYIAQCGGRDPLRRGIEIAGLPILAPGVLAGLARELEMSKADAARFWAGVLNSVLPYIHQRLSQLSVLPAGTPGSGQPIYWGDLGSALIEDAAREDEAA
jgi:hypothetical protein